MRRSNLAASTSSNGWRTHGPTAVGSTSLFRWGRRRLSTSFCTVNRTARPGLPGDIARGLVALCGCATHNQPKPGAVLPCLQFLTFYALMLVGFLFLWGMMRSTAK